MSNKVPSCWGELMLLLNSFEDSFLKKHENHIRGLFEREYDRLTIGMVIPETERQKALEIFGDIERAQVCNRGVSLLPLSLIVPTQSLL